MLKDGNGDLILIPQGDIAAEDGEGTGAYVSALIRLGMNGVANGAAAGANGHHNEVQGVV